MSSRHPSELRCRDLPNLGIHPYKVNDVKSQVRCVLPVDGAVGGCRNAGAETGRVYLSRCSLLSVPHHLYSQIQHFLCVFADPRLVLACLGLI